MARDQYKNYNFDKQKLLNRIEELLPEYTARFETYTAEDQQRRIQKARTNFKLDGVKDYTKLSDEEKERLYKWSRIYNETFLDADYEVRGNDFFESENNIPLLFSFGLGPGGEAWLHIGSSHSSMTDFWAGTGILEVREDGKIVERILSRTQFENLKEQLIKVNVDTPLSSICKNFNYIYAYEGTLKI